MKNGQAGRPESNVYISSTRFNNAKNLAGKSMELLRCEVDVTYRTLQRARNEETISYKNLIALSKALDVSPAYLQEDGIENWKVYSKEEQEEYKRSKNSNARFDDDGYYIYTFHEYEEAKKYFDSYVKQVKDQLEFSNKMHNSLAEIVRPHCLTPFGEDAEEIDKFLNEFIDDIYLDLHECINKRIREYMMMHSDDDPRYAFMREMFNPYEDKY